MNSLMTDSEADRIAKEELAAAFDSIQQPRSDYQLERFVVFEKDTEPAAYAQCVLEMQIKHQTIRRSNLSKRKIEIEIRRLRESPDEVDDITAEELLIDIEALEAARLGALREFACLYRIFKGFERQYTYEELQAAQEEYWQRRLVRQGQQDIGAVGRIGQGNQDALRMAGIAGWNDQGQPLLSQFE